MMCCRRMRRGQRRPVTSHVVAVRLGRSSLAVCQLLLGMYILLFSVGGIVVVVLCSLLQGRGEVRGDVVVVLEQRWHGLVG